QTGQFGMFHTAVQDDHLLPEEGIFNDQFHFTPQQIGGCLQHLRGSRGFGLGFYPVLCFLQNCRAEMLNRSEPYASHDEILPPTFSLGASFYRRSLDFVDVGDTVACQAAFSRTDGPIGPYSITPPKSQGNTKVLHFRVSRMASRYS